MPDLSAIAGVFSSLQAVGDITKAMIGLRDAQAFQAKALELQGVVMDAQSAAFSANQERATLIEEVGKLKQQIVQMEAWEREKQRYQLQQLPPGVFVYALKPEMADGEPFHSICQACYQRGQKSILQADEESLGIHHLTCTTCGTKLTVGHYRKPEVNHSRSPSPEPRGRY